MFLDLPRVTISRLGPDELLDAYMQSRDRRLQGDLVEAYSPLIRRAVHFTKHVWSAPGLMEEGIASDEGALGLLSAVERYEPGKGNFESFAYPRIKGRIIDYFKRVGPEHRTRHFVGPVRLQETTDSDDATGAMPITRVSVLSLDMLIELEGKDRMRIRDDVLNDDLVNGRHPFDEKIALRAELRAVWESAKKILDARSLYVLERIMDGMTNQEIGFEIGRSESGVSRIHTAAARKITEHMLQDAAVDGFRS